PPPSPPFPYTTLFRSLGRSRRPADRPPVRIAIHPQVLFQHRPQVSALRGDVGELLQRRERLLDLARLLHPLGVFEEILLRFGHRSEEHTSELQSQSNL